MHEKREADSRLRSRYHVKCGGMGDSLHVNSQGEESEGMIGSVMCVSLCNKATAYQNFAAAFRPHPLYFLLLFVLFFFYWLFLNFSKYISLGLYISQRNRHHPQIVAETTYCEINSSCGI